KMKCTEEQIDKMITARRSGITLADIAGAFKVSTTTIQTYLYARGEYFPKAGADPIHHSHFPRSEYKRD
ncbi:MAG: hypothetical protein KAH01_07660, partial [Caldisericia bacterium]|nr:hypothetical protein [Caldisericia bacterium]